MNPDSEIYMFRGLVSEKADMKPKAAFLLNHGAERVLAFHKVREQFLHLYQRLWQNGLKPGAHQVMTQDSNKEFGMGAGMDTALPSIFLKELVENN